MPIFLTKAKSLSEYNCCRKVYLWGESEKWHFYHFIINFLTKTKTLFKKKLKEKLTCEKKVTLFQRFQPLIHFLPRLAGGRHFFVSEKKMCLFKFFITQKYLIILIGCHLSLKCENFLVKRVYQSAPSFICTLSYGMSWF